MRQDEGEDFYYLDYLANRFFLKSSEEYNHMLRTINNIIKEGKQSSVDSIKEKYEWLEDYYNIVSRTNRNKTVSEPKGTKGDDLQITEDYSFIKKPLDEKILSEIEQYNKVASEYLNEKEYDKALLSLNIVLKLKEQNRGKEDLFTAKTYNNIGEVYRYQREYKLALQYYQLALSIYAKNLRFDHHDVRELQSNIAHMKRMLHKS